MKLMHDKFGSAVHLGHVVDDFGWEHNLILGRGDFGDCSCPAYEQHSLHHWHQMQDPDAFDALWAEIDYEHKERDRMGAQDAQAEMMKEEV